MATSNWAWFAGWVAPTVAPAPPPPPVNTAVELETGAGQVELEDGSGVILLE